MPKWMDIILSSEAQKNCCANNKDMNYMHVTDNTLCPHGFSIVIGIEIITIYQFLKIFFLDTPCRHNKYLC